MGSRRRRPRSTRGDLDGDGDLDLVSANTGPPIDGGVTIFRQTSPGRFSPRPTELLHPALRMPNVVKIRDIEADGEQDLIVGDSFFGVTVFYAGR